MTTTTKSLSKGGVYYLIYNVLNLMFPLLTGIYVARKLLPTNIGEVTAAQNLSTYFVIFAFLGIPTYGLKEIAKTRNNREERDKLYSELFTINLISTIVFSIMYIILVLLVPQYRENLTLYLVVGISITLNVFNVSWLYEGMEEFQFISIRNILFKMLSFGCLVLSVRGPEDFLAYAAITVIGTAGNCIVNMVYAPRFATLSFRGLNLKRHMKSILFLVAVNLGIEIYSLMDVTMMNFMSSKESIAYYRYGNSIQKMLLQIVNTFTMVLVPRISLYYKERKMNEFNVLVSKGLKLIILTGVPMIVGVFFTADYLIEQMYGAQFANSAVVLKMLSTLLLISPIGYLLGSRILLATDHENKMMICVGIGGVVNLIGNALMIPRLHEFGATFASIVSEICVMVVYIGFGKRYFHLIDVNKTAFKVLLSVTLMGIYLYFCSRIPVNGWVVLALQVVGAIAIYVTVLLVEREPIVEQYVTAIKNKVTVRPRMRV